MKKTNTLLGIIILFGFFSPAFLFGQWNLENAGLSDELRSVFFTTPSEGYAVGGNAYTSRVILKTADAGATWNRLAISGTFHLNSVWFTSASTGYVAGALGVIMKTTDGGNTWQENTSGTTEELNKIRFLNENIGYAIGDKGIILKTLNGGYSWAALVSGTSLDLFAVSIVNENVVYVVGDKGVVLKSTDGGASWELKDDSNDLLTGSNMFIRANDVAFLNADTGFATTTLGGIAKTTDGAISWSIKQTPDTFLTTFSNQVNAIDIHSFTAVVSETNDAKNPGIFGYILRSDDQGEHWTVEYESTTPLYGLHFPNDHTGYASGGTGTILSKNAPLGLRNFSPNGQTEIRIYPNPSSGVFTLRTEKMDPQDDNIQVSIHTITGELLFQRNATRLMGDAPVDVSFLSAGIYLIRVQSERGLFSTGTFCIEK